MMKSYSGAMGFCWLISLGSDVYPWWLLGTWKLMKLALTPRKAMPLVHPSSFILPPSPTNGNDDHEKSYVVEEMMCPPRRWIVNEGGSSIDCRHEVK